MIAYIIESSITCDMPSVEEPHFNPRTLEATFRTLRPEWGFVVVVWNPDSPDIVREWHWNTAEERLRDRNEVGRVVERKATEREKREGQRQHEEDIVVESGRKITHGRHCTCSACGRQDWSEPGLAPCGMHGPSCPPVYAPLGAPGEPDPTVLPADELLRDEKALYCLCCVCGTISPESDWTYWQRNEEGADWRPSVPGEGDPMCRCPACGWEHTDTEDGSGVYQGTIAEMKEQRETDLPDAGEWWASRLAEVAAGTEEVG